jgi:hypothetical protein
LSFSTETEHGAPPLGLIKRVAPLSRPLPLPLRDRLSRLPLPLYSGRPLPLSVARAGRSGSGGQAQERPRDPLPAASSEWDLVLAATRRRGGAGKVAWCGLFLLPERCTAGRPHSGATQAAGKASPSSPKRIWRRSDCRQADLATGASIRLRASRLKASRPQGLVSAIDDNALLP